MHPSAAGVYEDIFRSAKKIIAVGCFSVGANQVDLDAARRRSRTS
nr:hypothetical protein [Rhizobium rhizogenes]